MESKIKKRYLLGAGLLAGVALGYYLNTNEGRAWRKKAAAQLDEYGNEIGGIASELGTLASNYAGEAKNKGSEFVNEVRHRGEHFAEQAKQTVASGKDWVNETAGSIKGTAADKIASAESSFKQGVNQAKAKVNSITKG